MIEGAWFDTGKRIQTYENGGGVKITIFVIHPIYFRKFDATVSKDKET